MENVNKITSEFEVRYKSDVPEGARRDKTILDDLRESSQKATRRDTPEEVRAANRQVLAENAGVASNRRAEGGREFMNRERIAELRSEIDTFEKSPIATEARKKLESLVSGGVTDPSRRRVIMMSLRESLGEQMREIRNMRARVNDVAIPLMGDERAGLNDQLDESTAKMLVFGDTLNKVSDTAKRAALPQYFTSVASAAISAASTLVQYNKTGELAFDLSTPQGMVNASMQGDITRKKIAFSGIGSVLGIGAAAALAPFTGGMSLMSAFAGLSVGSMAGGALGEYFTTKDEKELKLLTAKIGRSTSNVMGFLPLQSKLRDISVMSGLGDRAISGEMVGSKEFKGLAGSYSAQGFSPEQSAQTMSGIMHASGRMSKETLDAIVNFKAGTRIDATGATAITRLTGKDIKGGEIKAMEAMAGRQGITGGARLQEFISNFPQMFQMAGIQFTDPKNINRAGWALNEMPDVLFDKNVPEWARNPEGRQQIFQGFSSLTNPKSEAERAFMFSALHKEGSSFIDTSLRMREGIFGKGNLSDILKMIPKGQEEAYLMALTEGKGVNTGVVRQMMTDLSGEKRGEFMDRWGNAEAHGADMKQYVNNYYGKGGKNNAPSGDVFNAEVATSKMESAQKTLDVVLKGVKDFEVLLNEFSSNPIAIKEAMDKALKQARETLGLAEVKPSPNTPRTYTPKKNEPASKDVSVSRFIQ